MKESVATSCRMSSIGNSGARSSGPTGCSVPGCSGGGGGTGRSGITLYHCCGISDSSKVILVRSVTAGLLLKIFPAPYARLHHRGPLPPFTTRFQSTVSSAHQRLHRGGQLGHGLLRVGEVHAG